MGENELAQRSVIFRMRLLRLGPGLPRRIGNERLLARNRDELSAHSWQQIGPVGLQPVAVPLGSLAQSPVSRNLGWISDFLYDQFGIFHDSARFPCVAAPISIALLVPDDNFRASQDAVVLYRSPPSPR